jgi:hypothetical protein
MPDTDWEPWTFQLWRDVDESGVSGTGRVAVGVYFPATEHCVLEWLVKPHTMGIYNSLADLIKVHGHGGKTRVIWLDEQGLRLPPERLLPKSERLFQTVPLRPKVPPKPAERMRAPPPPGPDETCCFCGKTRAEHKPPPCCWRWWWPWHEHGRA